MKKWSSIILLVFIACTTGFAQKKKSEQLQQKQRELEKKIENTRNLIGSTKNNQRLTITELAIINQQISLREELLGTISSQVRLLNQQIEENKSVIEAMTIDLQHYKEQYAKMIFYAYMHRNTYNRIMFVFASRDFNQAFLRIKYLKQFTDARKHQVEMIRSTTEELNARNLELDVKRQEKQGLASMQENEKLNYQKDKEKQQVALSSLQKEEKELRNLLDQQERKKHELALEVKKAIEHEVYLQRQAELKKQKEEEKRKADAATKNNGKNQTGGGSEEKKNPTTFVETSEGAIQSNRFENDKGKLPWPVEKGVVTQYFGKNPHPTLANVFTNNNGVDIGAPKGAKVRSVYDGVISSIFVIPGAGKAVMISHGSYRTVYANLAEVVVKKGDKVKVKQEIGTLLPGENNTSEVHFEIWKITEEDYLKQDPLAWLFR
jgi:murein hydrolase activator